MPQVHRQFDTNTAGAAVVSIGQSSVFTNYQLTSVDGSSVEGHGIGEHASPVTANGSPTVFVEYIPVNTQGAADTCGHDRAAGSPDVFANG